MGRRSRRDGKERSDRRVDHQYDPAADNLLVGKVRGNPMLSERRIYPAGPVRRRDLVKRFDPITLGIRQRRGNEQPGSWTTGIGDSTQALYYPLKRESLAHREKKWNAFQADPEWHPKRAETEKNGAIVARVENSILQPTNFSSVK